MHARRTRQHGAALVVGLLLLVVLTLLAIAGMNTASTELVMAGNEQFREGAFQAAEAGVEEQLPKLDAIAPDTAAPVTTTKDLGNNTGYTTVSQYRGEGSVPGSSTKFVGFYYDVQSTGTAKRNATALQTQGAYIVNQSGE
jgi:Tfp pilus assembly protein PilX